VRSVAVGIWLTRGSRHEPDDSPGIAHFVEHMLFKGTPGRNAEEIAQQVDSIGGQIDAFTSKEYAGYYLKVLDEHLPLAVDILADLICNPLFADDDIEREKKVGALRGATASGPPGERHSAAVWLVATEGRRRHTSRPARLSIRATFARRLRALLSEDA
jgi:hypothetical protein